MNRRFFNLNPTNRFALIGILALSLLTSIGHIQAQIVSAPLRIRATIEKVNGSNITVKEKNGEVFNISINEITNISECLPITIEEIKAGSFIGSGAMPQIDGTLKAVEVLVFPESMRGTGEGHRAWDVLPQSTMTNATVAEVSAGSGPIGRTLKLKYKDGEKILLIPKDAPIVTFTPGDKSLLVVGAKLIVNLQEIEGKYIATRIIAGRNGFQPPM
jgi:hypothetical protein